MEKGRCPGPCGDITQPRATALYLIRMHDALLKTLCRLLVRVKQRCIIKVAALGADLSSVFVSGRYKS